MEWIGSKAQETRPLDVLRETQIEQLVYRNSTTLLVFSFFIDMSHFPGLQEGKHSSLHTLGGAMGAGSKIRRRPLTAQIRAFTVLNVG